MLDTTKSRLSVIPRRSSQKYKAMDIKEVACDAFAKVLEEQFGLNVISESRADQRLTFWLAETIIIK